MLEGEYEKIIDQFYEKISLFFHNFKNSRKSPKHFDDLIKIINISINNLFVWKSQIGKLYLIMLLFEQISLLKDYLGFFNVNFRQTNEPYEPGDYSNRDSELVSPFDLRYESIGAAIPGSAGLPPHELGDGMDERNSSQRKISMPMLNLRKNMSTQRTLNSNMYFNEKPADFDRRGLPEVLVVIFKLILLLSTDEDEEMEKVRNILFDLFKSLFADLDLETIINMNRQLIENKPSTDSVSPSKKNWKKLKQTVMISEVQKMEARLESNPKIVLVRLGCFQEIVSILKTKLSIAKNDDRVLMMFEGIVESILRDLYDSSEVITEKIYNLLEEILIIRSDMEEMVCRSLFRCIKSKYNQMGQEKTKEFIQIVLNKINPKCFINILVQYIDERFYVDNNRSKESRRVMNEIVNYITVILTYYEKRGQILADLLFGLEFNTEVFYLWCWCPTALLKAGLFCKMFDFCILVLENEISDPKNDATKVLNLAKGAEDMLAMINTFKFTQIMNSITNPQIKKKIVSLAASLSLLASNSKRWVDLVKKLKIEYWTDAPARQDSKELDEYDSKNAELFEIYLHFKESTGSPTSSIINKMRSISRFSNDSSSK